jgi:hypothetical protein
MTSEEPRSVTERIVGAFNEHPILKCKQAHFCTVQYSVADAPLLTPNKALLITAVLALFALVFLSIVIGSVPGILPIALFAVHSYWIPQIWRNARRGSSQALERSFVLGTTFGRLALPLCKLSLQ